VSPRGHEVPLNSQLYRLHCVPFPGAFDRCRRGCVVGLTKRVPLSHLAPPPSMPAPRLRLFSVFALGHRFMRLTSHTIAWWLVLVLRLHNWLLSRLGSRAVFRRWRLRHVFDFRLRSLGLRPQVTRLWIIDVELLCKRFFRLCFAFCGILSSDWRRHWRSAETGRTRSRKSWKPHRGVNNTREHILAMNKVTSDL
jgi:hypothetical protein